MRAEFVSLALLREITVSSQWRFPRHSQSQGSKSRIVLSPPWSRTPLLPHSTPPAGAVQFSVGYNFLFVPVPPGPGKQLQLGSLVTLHPSGSVG